VSAPRLERVHGAQIEPYLAALSALRIAVFREYPYLYEGSLSYEQQYLRSYAQSEQSTVVLACDGEQVVGAATAMPLVLHAENLAPVLAKGGYDPQRVYYFGESVLLPSYRGLRIGHAFFDEREAAARRHGFMMAAFCAVQRADDHAARPAGYVPHDAFWSKRGYQKHPEISTRFAWCDVGDTNETEKNMVFWLRELTS
jgi:GNAT superfamily N-acetyltransferase